MSAAPAASIHARLLNRAKVRGKDVLDAQHLADAIAATFARRGIVAPVEMPLGLTDEFAQSPAKRAQWKAFLGKNRLDAPALDEVLADVRGLVALPLALARGNGKGMP